MTIYRGAGGRFGPKPVDAPAVATTPPAVATTPPARQELAAFKGFYKNPEGVLSCRQHEFEIGKEYSIDKKFRIEMCYRGFHACINPFDVLRYYNFSATTAFGKVRLLDEVVTVPPRHDSDKSVGRTVVVDEELNIHHLMRTFAKWVKDKKPAPYMGAVSLNQNDAQTNDKSFFDLQIDHVYAPSQQISLATRGFQLNNLSGLEMIATQGGVTQVSSGGQMKMTSLSGGNQFSYGDHAQHFLYGYPGKAVAFGKNASIVMDGPGHQFQGPAGTRFSIAANWDVYGKKSPAKDGVIGQDGVPADELISLRGQRSQAIEYVLG